MGRLSSRKAIRYIDIGPPATGLPTLEAAADHLQDGALRVRILLAMGLGVRPDDHGHTRDTGPTEHRIDVSIGVVDEHQEMPSRLKRVATERITLIERGGEQCPQCISAGREVAGGSDSVDTAGNIGVRQPFPPGPVDGLEGRGRQRDTQHRRIMPGDRLRDPGAHRIAHLVRRSQDRDAGYLGQVDADRSVAHRPMYVEQPAQGGVRHRFQVDLVGGVLDPQWGTQRHIGDTGTHHQEVGVVRVTLPLTTGSRYRGQRIRFGMRPFQRGSLRGGLGTDIVPHHRQIAQVVRALGVNLLGPQFVVRTAVQRARRQQQYEREEQHGR